MNCVILYSAINLNVLKVVTRAALPSLDTYDQVTLTLHHVMVIVPDNFRDTRYVGNL